MDRTKILDAVYGACETVLQVDRSTLSPATSFADDLEADSLSLVEIVMDLEEAFDLRIPEEDLRGVVTIGDAADLVGSHLSTAGL